MRFNSGKEMLDKIKVEERDLYNKDSCLYVWVYNDVGSIGYGYVWPEDVDKMRALSKETGEYWGAFINAFSQSWVVDDPDCEDYKEGDYSNLDFCNDKYEGEWEDVTPEEVD